MKGKNDKDRKGNKDRRKAFTRIVQDKKESPAPESVPVQFIIDGSLGKYISFIENLRKALADHKDPKSMSCFKNSDWREPHILLPKQIAPGPARWIEIKLSEGEHNTTLFVRDDNVYLMGFENKNKKRYQAGRGRGCGGQSSGAPNESEKMPDQILKDATPLGYDLSYRDLGGDSSKWKLGIFDAKKAVHKLSAYGTEENSNECIKEYLVTLIVMICEAARMCRIENKVKEGWSSKGIIRFSTDKKKGSVHLTTIERDTLNQWVQMSQAMMRWGDYTPGLEKIEVRNDKEAGEVVRLIKYAKTFRKDDTAPGGDDPSPPSPRGGGNGDGGDAPPADAPADGNGDGAPTGGGSRDGTSQGGGNGDPPPTDRNGKNLQHAPEGNGKRQQQQRQQQGRSLVEISSIHLTEGCTLPHVGSITVFDGKRGQIIYWNEEDGDAPRVDSKADLILTGPYRAISAGGRVALRITSVSDSDAAEEDLLIWDPYAKDAHEDIDELVSGDITEGLMLTYAVLRSAVEATVQVDVFLARGIDFFGEISAHSKLENGEVVSVVLFSREINDRVVFEPSSAGSTIPLTRSVLAWPVGSPLKIKVVYFHSISLWRYKLQLRTKEEHFFEGLELSFEDHADKIRFATLEGFGFIRVSVDDTGKYREKTNNSLPRSLMNQMSRDMSTEARHDANLALAAERTKLLGVQSSHPGLINLEGKRFIIVLLHLTNDSDGQHVAFRCSSILEGDGGFLGFLEHPVAAPKWMLSGIVPPNSTSTYLLRSKIGYMEMKSHSVILESCALQDEKHVDTIFPVTREGTEKTAEEDVGLDTIFRAANERTEKVTLKVSVSDPADGTTPSAKDKQEDDPPLPSQKDKQEDDLLIWDPYTEDHYDELVSGDIAQGHTLTYAVLRSYVEATVQVDLFLARGTDFFGEISAHSILANGEEVSVVLFSREIKDRVVFEPSSAGSTVPLTRSVLAWAVGSPLLIKVKRCRSVNLTHNGLHLRTKVEHSFRSLEFSFDDQKDKICFDTLHGFGDIRVSVDDTREHRKKSDSNSLPRSLDQLSRDQTLAAEQDTMGFREESSNLENLNDPMWMDILERGFGAQDSMGPEDIGTRPKLLVVRTSKLRLITFEHEMFITCLLHLTNNSNNQHVAFRCCSVLGYHFHGLSGILPPNSTSAYLVRHEGEKDLLLGVDKLSLYLESVNTIFPAAGEGIEKVTQSATVSEPADEVTTSEQAEDDVGLDTIFEAAKERTQKVTLKATRRTFTSEQAEGDEDLDTLFSRTSKGIKEVTIKATVSHPADVPMTSETAMKVPVTESSINQSDLDVYPLQLRFPFEQDKVVCCPLRLTNRTDYHVIFKCLPYTSYSYLYTMDHLNGILPPRSSCTYVVAMEKQKDVPDNMDALSLILKSCVGEKITGPDEYISSEDPMRERNTPRIEIITGTATDSKISSMDVHPTEPWIVASHFDGSVAIWNYQTQERVIGLKISHFEDRVSRWIGSAKFIAREKWIVAGGGSGFIYVVKYTTKEVSKFQAHGTVVESLAVHPKEPFVLSASFDKTIKLWNWDVNREPIWQHTRTFSGHSELLKHVLFNPYDNGNTFASASHDGTVKIWTTDATEPIDILDCHGDRQEHVAYFFMDGRPRMITGSTKGAARVWDLTNTKEPTTELDGTDYFNYGSNVGVVNCVPDNINPILITVSGDKSISLLDAATYKPRYDKVNFGLGGPKGFAQIEVNGRRSLVVAFTGGIAIMEMNEHPASPATVEHAQEGIYSA